MSKLTKQQEKELNWAFGISMALIVFLAFCMWAFPLEVVKADTTSTGHEVIHTYHGAIIRRNAQPPVFLDREHLPPRRDHQWRTIPVQPSGRSVPPRYIELEWRQ